MLDTQAGRKIRVSTAGNTFPFIMVPVSLVDLVRDILTSHDISHWVESGSVSFDGRPAIAIINLGLGVDVARTQAILDQVS
jgi:hypothetical protein